MRMLINTLYGVLEQWWGFLAQRLTCIAISQIQRCSYPLSFFRPAQV